MSEGARGDGWPVVYRPDGLPVHGTAAQRLEAVAAELGRDRRLADDHVDVAGASVRVLSVFLPIDHSYETGEHVPMLWETSLFVDGYLIAKTRSSSQEQSLDAHACMLERARTGWWSG